MEQVIYHLKNIECILIFLTVALVLLSLANAMKGQ